LSGTVVEACGACLRRAWLLCELEGHLDRERARIHELLELPDEQLIVAVGGARSARVLQRWEGFDHRRAVQRLRLAGVDAVCRCAPRYPPRLRELAAPPAVLHVAGGLEALLAACGGDAVALVGSRRASAYGLEVARSLARSLAAAGIPVIGGLALGIDRAAHEGALSAPVRGGPTVAVLAADPRRAYPASATSLHRRIVVTGAVVSELGPATSTRRWMFPARNRLIAALASMTIVVEAGARSGALITAGIARSLGRLVGAVPGHVTSPLAVGCHALLRDGARLIRGPGDVLEELFGAGSPPPAPPPPDPRPALGSSHRELVQAIGAGLDTPAALASAGIAPEQGLAALAWLELAGYVRRQPGGRWSVVP
jgi:DNA processing protein